MGGEEGEKMMEEQDIEKIKEALKEAEGEIGEEDENKEDENRGG